MSTAPRPTPSFASRHSFTPFVVYRVLLGIPLLALSGAGPLG